MSNLSKTILNPNSVGISVSGFCDTDGYGLPYPGPSDGDLYYDMNTVSIKSYNQNNSSWDNTNNIIPNGTIIRSDSDDAWFSVWSYDNATQVRPLNVGKLNWEFVDYDGTFELNVYPGPCDTQGSFSLNSQNSSSNEYNFNIYSNIDSDTYYSYRYLDGHTHTLVIENLKSSDVDFTVSYTQGATGTILSGVDSNNTFTVPAGGAAEVSIMFLKLGGDDTQTSSLSFIVKTDFEIKQ